VRACVRACLTLLISVMWCVLGGLGNPKGYSGHYLVFSHPTCLHLPCELPGTSQLKCSPWVSHLHGGQSWKRQRPFKDKAHNDDDDDDDVVCVCV